MKLKKTEQNVSLKTFHYEVRLSADGFQLVNPRRNDVLLDVPSAAIFQPELNGVAGAWSFDQVGAESTESSVLIQVSFTPESDAFGPLTLHIKCFHEHIEFQAECDAGQDGVLAYWNFFTPGSQISAFWAHHFRNRHGNVSTYETYNLMQGQKENSQDPTNSAVPIPPEIVRQWMEGADFTTFSTDWQFAPHPTCVLFQKDEVMLGLAARDLPQAFGMEVSIGQNTVKTWRLDCGGEHGLAVKAGARLSSPRMYLWLGHHEDVWDQVDRYVELLREDGMISSRSLRHTPAWWYKPAYCTWLDQGFIANHSYSHLHKTDGWTGKKKKKSGGRYDVLDDEMIDAILDTMQRECLPFGSMILDASWFIAQGHWEADKERFPDMRKTIEKIHDAGLKALLWISPFMFEPDIELVEKKPELFLNNGETLPQYPYPQIDFSNPTVQEEFLKPLMRYLIGSDSDCLNADGLKLDYMAGKIFPEHRVHDPAWYGEERFIYNATKMMYDEMKRHKPDACMVGVSAHPSFMDCQDLIRTYDVPGSIWQHSERTVMIRHFCPDTLVTFDMSEDQADWDRHFHLAEKSNALVEHGNILGVEAPLLADDYAFLRTRLARWG